VKHREQRELQEYRDRPEVEKHWHQIEMRAVAAAARYAGKQKYKQKQMRAGNDIQPQLK
jgi:hypothetical protein